jgi:hypothetical protein
MAGRSGSVDAAVGAAVDSTRAEANAVAMAMSAWLDRKAR